jgi:hypothetical protein
LLPATLFCGGASPWSPSRPSKGKRQGIAMSTAPRARCRTRACTPQAHPPEDGTKKGAQVDFYLGDDGEVHKRRHPLQMISRLVWLNIRLCTIHCPKNYNPQNPNPNK